MISPTLVILFACLRFLFGGQISVFCGDVGMVEQQSQPITPGSIWTISCVDSWNSSGTYHYVPSGGTQLLTPSCNTSTQTTVYQKIYNVSGTLIREGSTVVPVNWMCSESSRTFDSTFNLAISDVAKSVNFWGLFLAGIGAGIFLGVAPLAVNSIKSLLDGGKDEE